MMRRLKYSISIMVLILLIGCSNNLQSEPAEIIDQEPVTLHYISYSLNSAQAGSVYADVIREFEQQHPEIRIQTEFIQNTNYTNRVKIKLLGGEPIDVFDLWSPSLFEELRNLDANIFLSYSDTEFLSQFLPQTLEPVTRNGKVYAVPEVMHTDGLLYNADMFEQFGWDIPHTWDEFIELCYAIKEKGIIPIAVDGEWDTSQFFWGSMMSNNGADEAWTKKLENGMISISDPIFIDSIQKQRELIEKEFVPSEWYKLKKEQSKDLILQEKAAMIITGTWNIIGFLNQSPEMNIGFMLVPGVEQTIPNVNVGNYRVVHSKSQYPEEAQKFVSFMNSKQTLQKIAEGAIAVPSIKDAQLNNDIVAEIAKIVTHEEAKIYWPHTVSTETLQVKILEEVNNYLMSGDLDKALHEIDKAIEQSRMNRRQ